MPIEELYLDYGIETAPEEHRHYREGWVNIPCPHCAGSEGYHLGFNIDERYFYCWRCGSHFIDKTISLLLNINIKQAKSIIKNYRLDKKGSIRSSPNRLIKIGKKKFKYPSGVSKMSKPHIRYLEKRNFDPDYIEDQWGVMGTGPTSTLDGIPYKYRLLAPIEWENQTVTFQCRDHTDKQSQKYMACPKEREIIHHKHLLYGLPELWKKRVGICVEGIFDVWRLKGHACGTFGIQYKSEQITLLSQIFDKLFILFDPEPQAQRQAIKLRDQLIFMGVEAYNYKDLETDPGDMSSRDVKYLLKELKLL